MVHFMCLLQEHKEEAQSGLEYYKKLTSRTESAYKCICLLQQRDQQESTELKRLKQEFSAFISADYMMEKIFHTGVNQLSPLKHIT